MKRLVLAGAMCTLLLATVSCQMTKQNAPASADAVIASPSDTREYKALKLDNQIEIILVSDPTVDKSAAALSVGVGLLQDPMTQQGMAHYLEHMLFLGTERFPESNGYSEFMSQNGGASNAYTWLDITNYMFEINNAAYDEALDRFSDFFKAPKLYEEYVEKEKNAVNAEWSMRREMDFFGQFKLSRSMMGTHPANRFLIGNLETLGDKEGSKLHSETVAFYDRYYSANIMKVAMVSNLSIAEMEVLAKKHFASIKNKNIDKPTVKDELNFNVLGAKRIHYVPNEDVKQLIIDFTIDNNVEDYKVKPNQFIGYLLGSEMPGTPASELKKAGLISSLNTIASPEQYGNYGIFSVQIDLTDAGMQSREEIVAVIMSYLDKIREEGVDEKYFKEIRTSLNNQFRFLEKGNAFGYVSNLADEMQTYPVTDVISAGYTYEKFDADAIREVLEQLTANRLRIWYVSKQEPSEQQLHFYDGKYKIVDISEDEIASWKKPTRFALTLPKVNTLLPEQFDLKQMEAYEKPQLVADNNGIKAWLYPSQVFANQPKGVVRVLLNNVKDTASIEGQVLSALWTDMYALNQSALITEADIAGMQLTLREQDGLELIISGFTDKQPELLSQGLKSIQFDVNENAFAQAVDRFVRGQKNQEKQFPIRQLFGHMQDVVSASGFESNQLIKTAQKLKPNDLAKFMQTILSNNQVRVFAFGNYDESDVNRVVAKINQFLPENRNILDYARGRIWKPSKGEVLSYKKDLSVADVAVLDMIIHPEPTVDQEARGRVLRGHMRTKAFDTLRTEEQLAYAVTAFTTQFRDYTTIGFAIQTPVKDAASMQARFDEFKKQYQTMLDKVTDAEFEQLKSSVLVTLKEAPKNLREEQAPLVSDWYKENWDFDSQQKLIDAVEKVTLDDLRKFYRETALSDTAARLSVQLRGSKFSDKPFADIKGEKVIDSLQKLHAQMSYQ